MRGDWRWYISIAAVKEWMRLTGRTGELEDDNPQFLAAQNELGDLSQTAHLTGKRPAVAGQQVWVGKVDFRGRRMRVECAVNPTPRKEGGLSQLVWVTMRGGASSGRDRHPQTTTPGNFQRGDWVECLDDRDGANFLDRGRGYRVESVQTDSRGGLRLNLAGMARAWEADRFRLISRADQ